MTAEEEQHERTGLGMAAAAAAIFMFTLMNVFAKYLSGSHTVFEIAFYRNAIALLPFLGAAFLFGRREILVLQSKVRLVVLRAVLGTVSLTVMFYAYSIMPMAETAVLLFTASLFIPVLGVVLLRELVGPWRWLAVLVGFAGVSVMLDPAGQVTAVGVAAGLMAALLQAVLSVLLRHLGGHERPESIAFYFFVVGTVLTGAMMPFVARVPTSGEFPALVGIGLSGAAAQWLYSVAMKHTPAAVIAILNYSSIVWATFFGWAIWNEWPATRVFAGSAIVIGANLFIVWREMRTSRRARAASVIGRTPPP